MMPCGGLCRFLAPATAAQNGRTSGAVARPFPRLIDPHWFASALRAASQFVAQGASPCQRRGLLFLSSFPRHTAKRNHDDLLRMHLTTRAVENLVKKYTRLIRLDPPLVHNQEHRRRGRCALQPNPGNVLAPW